MGLALDALASTCTVPDKVSKQNQHKVQAMRLRYGLDDDRPRKLKEVCALLWSLPGPFIRSLHPPSL